MHAGETKVCSFGLSTRGKGRQGGQSAGKKHEAEVTRTNPSRAWLTMQGFIHCSPTWLGNCSPLDGRRATTGQMVNNLSFYLLDAGRDRVINSIKNSNSLRNISL